MKTILVICKNCDLEFGKSVYEIRRNEKNGRFIHFCSVKCSCAYNKKIIKNNNKKRIDNYYKNPKKCLNCLNSIDFKCKNNNQYCSIRCASIYTQKNGGHKKWSDEEKKELSINTKKLWKSGHYNELITRTEKKCESCNKIFIGYENEPNKNCCSRKCKNEWIKRTGYMKGKSGGFRLNGGRSKRGWYKGIHCQSTYELAWVIYNLDNNIPFRRSTEWFGYINSKGENRKYYPDFYLDSEESYIEIKGYKEKEFENKQKYFPKKIIVIEKNQIKKYIDYVKQIYKTKKIETLYDK